MRLHSEALEDISEVGWWGLVGRTSFNQLPTMNERLALTSHRILLRPECERELAE